MSIPTTSFSALSAERQEQITKFLTPLNGEFNYDIVFDRDGCSIISSERGFTLEELRTWSKVLSTKNV